MNFGLAPIKQEGTAVWCGDYGDYLIPDWLLKVTKFRKGREYPDKRYKASYKFFMGWVAEQDQHAKEFW